MTNPPMSLEEIHRRFGYHKPVTDDPGHINTAPIHAELRRAYMRFAHLLDQMLPNGRYKDKALEELEGTAMWSHKAVAMQDPVADEHDDANFDPKLI